MIDSPRKHRSTSLDFVGKKRVNMLQTIVGRTGTIAFKDTVIRAADVSNDSYGRAVKNRINFDFDLLASN